MNEKLAIFLNLAVMLGLVYVLFRMQKKHCSFTKRVMVALGLGILYGTILQVIFGASSNVVKESNAWFYVIGSGYVRLLKMIVTPLIMVSITSAITNLKDSKTLGKMGGQIIGILVLLTLIAAFVGAGTSLVFDLSAVGLEAGEAELNRAEYLENKLTQVQSTTVQQQLTQIIPTNPFYSMTGQGSTATLSVVIFSAFIGIATLGLKRKKPESAEFFVNMVNATHDVVMRLVTLILRLTPFGVLALMTKVTSTSDFGQILRLLKFIIASYIAIFVMFIVHMIVVALVGLSPFTFIKKVFPVLTFAFTSRTSAGTIPLNVETQVKKLGVPESFANLSASFGASIGQNGCAGIYPAMLAVMVAPAVGINPLSVGFLLKLALIVGISSFGVAGVGGGATFAALIVLSSMGLPVGLVGLLISIEPLIDMARTALNVSGAMIAGVVSSKMMKELDLNTYNAANIEIGVE